MRWWAKNQQSWGTAYLHDFYVDLYKSRPHVLDDNWWKRTVDMLWDWRAIRSPKPPNSKADIQERGLSRLSEINTHYQKIMNASPAEPTLQSIDWDQIAPLYEIMSEIKGSPSPVFPSKLGHFIFPRIFIIVDNKATAVFPYEAGWQMLQAAWNNYKDKDNAKAILIKEIEVTVSSNIHPDYPFETKIPELWLIGYKHKQSAGQ